MVVGGIGTTTPTAPLHVTTNATSGNIAVFSSYATGGAGCSIAWNGTSCSSDQRLKENIKTVDINQMLNEVMQLRPVHFTWIADKKHEHQTGFIAQELEKHFPEFVKTNDDGYKQVNYAHFVSVLTASIQQLYKNIVKVEQQQEIQARQIASKAEATDVQKWKAEADAKIQKLSAENAAKDKELQDLKVRLELLEKALTK